jgi:hypothetical protein
VNLKIEIINTSSRLANRAPVGFANADQPKAARISRDNESGPSAPFTENN